MDGVFSEATFPAPGQRFRTSMCSAIDALFVTSRIFAEWAIAQPTR
jgi:hypothetical protein